MRVIDPKELKKAKKPPKKPKKTLLLQFLLLIGILGIGYFLLFGQDVTTEAPGVHKENLQSEQIAEAANAPTKLKTFNGEGFKQLYSSFAYPNTEKITEKPSITGNREADKRIQEIAEERGYKLSAVPVSNIVRIDEPYLTEDDLMQPNAHLGWQDLMKSAKKDGIPIQITSAYRSIEFQRALFLREMANAGITAPGIADGYSDQAVNRLLDVVAPPGYSRHHTGYTMDLACNGIGLHAFKQTSCYDWLSKNNFENTKKFGWVPSYPEEAVNQGPEPEAWEYIWVGTAQLYE